MARKQIKTVVVIANDPMEARSYPVPVEYDRYLLVSPGHDNVDLVESDPVVGLFYTPNVVAHPLMWSTKAKLVELCGIDAVELIAPVPVPDDAEPAADAEPVTDAATEAE